MGSRFVAESRVVRISGGTVGRRFHAHEHTAVTISGGVIGRGIAAPEAAVELIGGEFRLNGSPVAEGAVTLRSGDVLTGAFTDGSPFLFDVANFYRGEYGDLLKEVTLTSALLPEIDATPIVVDAARPSAPAGLRPGQSLTLRDGGVLGDFFTVLDASLVIEGGEIGDDLEVYGATVDISGGDLSGGIEVFPGSRINITGGAIGDLRVHQGSEVNLEVTELFHYQYPYDVRPGLEMDIWETSGPLTGILADGTPLVIDLNLVDRATLTVTFVATGVPGDYNNDWVVDAADYTVWRDNVGEEGTLLNDVDGGVIGQAQYQTWRANYGANGLADAPESAAVPEPAAAVLLLVGLSAIGYRLRAES